MRSQWHERVLERGEKAIARQDWAAVEEVLRESFAQPESARRAVTILRYKPEFWPSFVACLESPSEILWRYAGKVALLTIVGLAKLGLVGAAAYLAFRLAVSQ